MLTVDVTALFVILQSEKKSQQAPQKPPLHSPLSLRSVLTFGLLFLSLTIGSGLAQNSLGSRGFGSGDYWGAGKRCRVRSVGRGTHPSHRCRPCCSSDVLCDAVDLVENVVIFSTVVRNRTISIRLALLSLPTVLAGTLALVLAL